MHHYALTNYYSNPLNSSSAAEKPELWQQQSQQAARAFHSYSIACRTTTNTEFLALFHLVQSKQDPQTTGATERILKGTCMMTAASGSFTWGDDNEGAHSKGMFEKQFSSSSSHTTEGFLYPTVSYGSTVSSIQPRETRQNPVMFLVLLLKKI